MVEDDSKLLINDWYTVNEAVKSMWDVNHDKAFGPDLFNLKNVPNAMKMEFFAKEMAIIFNKGCIPKWMKVA